MSKIRVIIAGFGNVGRGVLASLAHNKDMELVAVFTRRDASTIKTYTNVVVINIGTNDNTYYRGLSGAAQEEATNLFLNNYKTLMKNIKTYYPDVKIVCVSNMMVELNGFLNMCMQGAVQQLNNEYGEFSYYLEFLPNNQGADGHPGLSAHISNAETLANFINTII